MLTLAINPLIKWIWLVAPGYYLLNSCGTNTTFPQDYKKVWCKLSFWHDHTSCDVPKLTCLKMIKKNEMLSSLSANVSEHQFSCWQFLFWSKNNHSVNTFKKPLSNLGSHYFRGKTIHLNSTASDKESHWSVLSLNLLPDHSFAFVRVIPQL